MYIAINRFKVMKGAESAFEHVWLSRDTRLDRVPGFVEFHLLGAHHKPGARSLPAGFLNAG